MIRARCPAQLLQLACGGQQANERIRIAVRALFENRSDKKLTRMGLVMLHVQTVLMICGTRLNGAVTSKNALVMLKRALEIQKFDHFISSKRRSWLIQSGMVCA
jgi:hypothetical protein